MSKITNKQIQDRVTQLQNDGFDIAIGFEGSPARGRLSTKDGDRFISDRMVSTDLAVFIDGWIEGHRHGVNAEKIRETLELKA